MPDTAAQTRLKAMTAAATEPLLSDTEIDNLLTQFSIVDADGYAPDEEDWVPTYNFRAAAAEGWRWKMGKCSDLVSTDLDGDRMSSNQMFDHCERMVRRYAGSASPDVSRYSVEADTFFSQ